jgi:hypothetical protein
VVPPPVMRHLRVVAGLVALLTLNSGVLAASALLAGPSDGTERPEASVVPAAESPALVLDPGSWWMIAGNVTRISATWSDVPAGCTSLPMWYRWLVVAGWAEGSLALSNTSTTVFTSTSTASGTARVQSSAATVIDCGGTETAVHQNATANVTVVVPPELDGLLVAPDPVESGAPTNLTGNLSGGEPPYQLKVLWGDGSVSLANLTAAGAFSLPHRFPAGTFAPSVEVEDSAGLVANATVEEPVYASTGLAVGIETVRPVVEVGVPVDFTGVILDAPSVFSWISTCSDSDTAPTPALGSAEGQNFSCTFSAPGVAQVEYEVVPSGDDLPATEAVLDLPVEAALGILVSLDGVPGEVGQPSSAAVDLTGGVPPFVLEWQLTSNASDQALTLLDDGAVWVPVWPSEAGTFGFSARATDSLGVAALNGTRRLFVDPALQSTETARGSLGPDGCNVSVSGTIPQGTPPFEWFVAPARISPGELPSNGTLRTVSGFAWSETLPFEGASTLTVGVVDADGSFSWGILAVDLVPPLSVTSALRAGTANNTTAVILNLTVQGGLPPFEVWSNLTDGSSQSLSYPLDGTYACSFPVNRSGWVTVTTTVVDQLGVRNWTNGSVDVRLPTVSPPPPPAPPPAAPPAGAGAGSAGTAESVEVEAAGLTLGLGASAVAAFLWRRRRRAQPATTAGPDPVTVLRQIIAPADGAERTTVELLAEEQGVPLSVVRGTLDRLIADGTVRAEAGPDGEEVVAWAQPDPS